MLINVKKAGLWAFKGIKVVALGTGVQEMIDDRAQELLDAGRAELPKEEKKETPKPEVVETIEPVIEKKDPVVETVEKGKSGWWSVKFEDVEKIVKVKGADDETEAITLAIAKLEVQ